MKLDRSIPIVEQKNDALIIRIEYRLVKDWEQWVLLTSDEHFDSRKCDRKLLKRHYDQAVERNALILNFGDFFDCMGGKYDPRTHKGDVRPEYQVADYFNALIEDAAGFLTPYKQNIGMMVQGNHEMSVLKRHEFDLLRDLRYKLDNSFWYRKYTGWLMFRFRSGGGNGVCKRMWYTHGSGGNAPVTKGTIQSARRQDYIDADYIVAGHIHTHYLMPRPRVRVNDRGRQVKYKQMHIQLGTYKDSFDSGWESFKGFPPAHLGGVWIRFHWNNHLEEIAADVFEAQ